LPGSDGQPSVVRDRISSRLPILHSYSRLERRAKPAAAQPISATHAGVTLTWSATGPRGPAARRSLCVSARLSPFPELNRGAWLGSGRPAASRHFFPLLCVSCKYPSSDRCPLIPTRHSLIWSYGWITTIPARTHSCRRAELNRLEDDEFCLPLPPTHEVVCVRGWLGYETYLASL
jgi:hypothetical protein